VRKFAKGDDMTSDRKAVISFVCLAILILPVSVLAAQSKAVPSAPVPAQILTAKKVFVANSGGDQPFYNDSLFNGGPDRAYNEFYAGMKASGRYELVGAPADADLLIEIALTVPAVSRPERESGQGETILGPVPYDAQFRVVIRDSKTNALLWAFTQHVQWAILQGNREKNFELAMAKLVSDVQSLGAPSVVPADGANKQ
jgi:hypothetical protein